MNEKIKCCILVCSDRCNSAEYEDRSGPVLKRHGCEILIKTFLKIGQISKELSLVSNICDSENFKL